jgi:thiol-disulfide isomerase/thioredoxin
MKKNILAIGLLAILCLGAGAYVGMRQMQPAPDSAAVSRLLAQTMKDAGGQEHALSQWKDKPLVVNFWATWCPPCVEEMPELSALQNEIAPKGVQIIGIGIDSPSNIAEFASKYKIGYPIYTAGIDATALAKQLGNPSGGLPFTVLVARDGSVRKSYLGRLKMEELRKDIAAL